MPNGIRRRIRTAAPFGSSALEFQFSTAWRLVPDLAKFGISALRLSLPYHDFRMPPELYRADYAVSANVGRTLDATRQAVVDARSCVDWLEQQGYSRLGILGTSLGSCYAFLASAHDERLKVNVFNHCSSYFADVVWTGLSTQHIRQGIEEHIRWIVCGTFGARSAR